MSVAPLAWLEEIANYGHWEENLLNIATALYYNYARY